MAAAARGVGGDMMGAVDPIDLPALRRHLRATRRGVSPLERARAARAVRDRILADGLLEGVRLLAAYLATDGEMDPAPLVEVARSRDVTVVLPRLATDGRIRMAMAVHEPGVDLVRGPFGLWQPPPRADEVAFERLDAVLVPVVAFAADGTRLGRGGGYYDRAFADRLSTRSKRPRLVGLAYAFQQVDRLERRPWDVPLDLVVTERSVCRFDG